MSEQITTLATIESLAKKYAGIRADLADRVAALDTELREAHARHTKGIRKALADAQTAQAALRAAITDAPGLFVKPKTLSLHGIKVGFQKGKGKLDWDDDAQLVKLIRKHHPEQFEVLVKTEFKIQKKALSGLTVAELRKLGCEVEESGEFVVVKAEDTGVDKLVKALLKEGLVEESDAPAEAAAA